jgi:hypothetical protein
VMRRFDRPAAGFQLLWGAVRRFGIAAVIGNQVEIAPGRESLPSFDPGR